MTVTKLLALLEQCDLSADVRLVAPAPPKRVPVLRGWDRGHGQRR